MAKIMRREPRQIKFTTGINPYAQGSVIVEFGNTKVHVTATVEESVPPFLKGKGKGWVTAEYSMLPSATHTRNQRERSKISGRTQEIQRLIGRSMRAIVDLNKLGERTLMVDCDVLLADGGTRTASITGAYVAVMMAVKKLLDDKKLSTSPILNQLAAISVGVNKQGDIIADLNYDEDSSCETDMNVVMTRDGNFIEVQGTAEGSPFSATQLTLLLEAAKDALQVIFKQQDQALV